MPRKLTTSSQPERLLIPVDNFNKVEFMLDGVYTSPNYCDDVPFFWPAHGKVCAFHLHANGYDYIREPMETISLSIIPEDKNVFVFFCRTCGFRLEIDLVSILSRSKLYDKVMHR